MVKRGFTLAEIMIVLAVIGVITSILLPVAIQSTPDEKVMKFKKGHATLYKVVNELVTSDKYYLDGDLGTKYDGTQIVGGAENPYGYFCSTFADILSTKETNCIQDKTAAATGVHGLMNILNPNSSMDAVACEALRNNSYIYEVTSEILNAAKEKMDSKCKATVPKSYILSSDNILYFEVSPPHLFGIKGRKDNGGCSDVSGNFPSRFLSPPSQFPAFYHDQNGFDVNYKLFCIDIDGIKEGEDPFGYGIRADGKILNGARADEWLEKNIQDRE